MTRIARVITKSTNVVVYMLIVPGIFSLGISPGYLFPEVIPPRDRFKGEVVKALPPIGHAVLLIKSYFLV